MADRTGKPLPGLPTGSAQELRNEIFDVMADDGYSAQARKSWLKQVLTDMSNAQKSDPERQRLAEEIRRILHEQVSDDTKADDTL